MNKILAEILLDIVSIPRDVERVTAEFDTHNVIVIDGRDARNLTLPLNFKVSVGKVNVPVYGIEAPDGERYLIVLDNSLDEDELLNHEDAEFFKNIEGLEFKCFLTHQTVHGFEIFRPLNKMIGTLPLHKDDDIYTYLTAAGGFSVCIKKGSNRQKFLEGRKDFLDDPNDYFATADKRAEAKMLNLYNEAPIVTLQNLVESNPLRACLTLFRYPTIKEIAKKAIKYRTSIPSIITPDEYWEYCEDPDSCDNSFFKNIDWERVETILKNEPDDYIEDYYEKLFRAMAFTSDASGYADMAVDIFFMFYLLLEDDKIEFIKTTFNLGD